MQILLLLDNGPIWILELAKIYLVMLVDLNVFRAYRKLELAKSSGSHMSGFAIRPGDHFLEQISGRSDDLGGSIVVKGKSDPSGYTDRNRFAI